MNNKTNFNEDVMFIVNLFNIQAWDMTCAYHFGIQFKTGVTSCVNIEIFFLGGGGEGCRGWAYLLYIFLIELPSL